MRLGIQPLVALLPALSPRHAAVTSCAHDNNLQLLTSYQQLVGALLDEVALSTSGDTVELGLYLLEGGESSARVLDALEVGQLPSTLQTRTAKFNGYAIDSYAWIGSTLYLATSMKTQNIRLC